MNFCHKSLPPGGGGELPYDEYMGDVPRIRVIFSKKNSEKGMLF